MGREGKTIVACALILAAAAPATPAAATPLNVKGRSFTTQAPAGWLEHTTSGPHDFRGYALTSLGGVDAVSVPDKGQVAVNVYETPIAKLGFKKPERQTAFTLAPRLIAVPRGATEVHRTTSGTTTLDGEEALTATYTYTYAGRHIRQQDTVAVHKGYALVVETNADTSSRARARRGRAKVQGAWHWR